MSDLENLWDDLPVGPAPTGAILREARAQSRPRRSRRWLLRPVSSIAALGAVGGAFIVGTYVAQPPNGSGPSAGGPGEGPAGAAAFHGELMAGESCDDLLDYYVERGLELVGPYGWGYPSYPVELTEEGWFGIPDQLSGAVADSAARSPQESYLAPGAPVAQRAESSETGTNVQEQGVDEPDVVKTDGERVFRIDDSTLTSYDVTGEEVEQLSSLDLGDVEDGEMFLAGDTVTVIGNDGTSAEQSPYGYYESAPPTTRVVSVDASDPANPEITATMDFDSSLVTARLHGETVRLITAAGLPELDFVQPGTGQDPLGEEAALERNQELVRTTTISDWLPTGSVDGGTDKRLAECEDVAVPKDDLGLDTMSVVGFEAADPTSWDVTALAANAPLAYASEDHLYLGASPIDWGGCFEVCPLTSGPTTTSSDDAGTTQVFDFDLTTTGTSYVGAGEVDGMVQDRWSMDEYAGTLRLAVSPTQRTGNFNSIVNLRREGDALVEVGRLDHLGEDETIQSVRWMDGLAILVTFRQIDPLYTLDLTDPEDPTLLGELKIPGFSDYLHPIGPRRLIGMGQGPDGNDWGAAAALFKVTDLTDPRRKDVISYGPGTQARAGADPRQFTWLPSKRLALTVISKGGQGQTGWVSVLSLDDGQLTNRMVEAEYGVEIDDLRLVPLPDGRVVMSTGDGAEFFDVDCPSRCEQRR